MGDEKEPGFFKRFFVGTSPRQYPSLEQNVLERIIQAILNILVVWIAGFPLFVLTWYYLRKYFASKENEKLVHELKKENKILKTEVETLKKQVEAQNRELEKRDEKIRGLEMNLGLGDHGDGDQWQHEENVDDWESSHSSESEEGQST